MEWVAVAGGTEGSQDPNPWFGRISDQRDEEDNTVSYYVTWLELCNDANIAGQYYQYSTSTPNAWIPEASVIVFGVDFALKLVKKIRRTVFRVQTPIALIKTIWRSNTKQETFDKLVKSITSSFSSTAIQETVKRHACLKKDLWRSEGELAL
ncbi:MAG: hypothetical protein IIC67_12395, partial [Thaumarchaeota archaeon]|nr:hypothetical protein [Nitrososphaerota archaeon]